MICLQDKGGAPMESYITRQEHEEFAKRIDAENKRQNQRIAMLEENGQHITSMTVSIEKMAVNMENMLEEQKRQGERLENLEKEPVEMQKSVKNSIITSVISTVVGIVIGALLSGII